MILCSQFSGSESPINQSEGCSKPHFWWLNALFSWRSTLQTLDFLTFRIIQARIDFKECCTSIFLPTSFMLSWGFLECQTGLNHLPYQASRLGHSKTNFGRYQCPKKNPWYNGAACPARSVFQTNLWGSNRFDQRIDSWNSTLFLFLAINDHLAGANPIHKYWHPTYISKQSLSHMNLIAKPWSKNKPQAIHWQYLVADCSRKVTNHPPTMHQPFTNHYDFCCTWVEFEDGPSNQLIYIYIYI